MANVQLAPVHTKLLKTWQVLGLGNVAFSHTGDTTEVAAATLTVPGGSMGPNGVLRVTTLWSWSALVMGEAGRISRIRFGGITGTAFGSYTWSWTDATTFSVTDTAHVTGQIITHIRNRNAQNVNFVGGVGVNGSRTNGVITATAIDTAVNQDIVITIKCGLATQTLALEAWMVELLYGA